MSSDLKSRQAAANKIKDSLPVNDCEPLISTLCLEKELLECTHIGVTTFLKYRVELNKKIGSADGHTPDTYALASAGLAGEVLKLRYKEDCFISFRITEDSGYVANIALTPAKKFCVAFKELFQNNLSTEKLKGKFHLEILFVDAQKVFDREFCEKYVENINSRSKNHSDSTSLMDKVEKAEKWLELARKKKKDTAYIAANAPQKPKHTVDTLFLNTGRYPSVVKTDHMFVTRYFVIHPYGICNNESGDLANVYAYFATKLYNTYCMENMANNTHTLFEFQTNDGHINMSKLRPHTKNNKEILWSEIKGQKVPVKSGLELYTVTIYCVDIPGFATEKKALSRINFMRKSFEKLFAYTDMEGITQYMAHKIPAILKRKMPPTIILNECTEPLEENCKCEKLHLSDYCIPKLVLDKRSDRMTMQRWSFKLSDFTIKLFKHQFASPLYAIIGNRICQNSFSKEFKVGTNIQFEIEIGKKMYTSVLRHHSDVGEKNIIDDMFKEESFDNSIEVTGEVSVTMYAVDILKFETNKEAQECANNFRMGKYEAEINKSLKPEPIVTPEEPLAKIVFSMNGLFPSTTLNSSSFKIGSNLSNKASTDLLKLNEAYEVLSSRTTIDTSKSKILLFLVEIDRQFHQDARNPLLLMANICLEIVSKNEVLLGKKKEITVKFHLGNNLVQVVLNEEYRWNATMLMVDMCKESMKTIEVPKKFYLEVHYRLMKKEDMF